MFDQPGAVAHRNPALFLKLSGSQDVTIFREFTWEDLADVNHVIGENDTGKSHLLRMLYAVSRSFQDFTRFDD